MEVEFYNHETQGVETMTFDEPGLTAETLRDRIELRGDTVFTIKAAGVTLYDSGDDPEEFARTGGWYA